MKGASKTISIIRQLFLICLCLIAFLLPFEPQFLFPIEAAAILFFILGYHPLLIVKNLNRHKKKGIWILAYLLLAAYCLPHTDNPEALRQLNVKLSFLLIPVMLFGAGLSSHAAKSILHWFIYGCFAACISLLCLATWDYLRFHDRSVFTYGAFSRYMHVTYFSMYILISMALLWMEEILNGTRLRFFMLLQLGVFMLCLFFISAKISLILFIPFSLICLYQWVNIHKRYLTGIAVALVLSSLPACLYLLSPSLKNRIDYGIQELVNPPEYTSGIASTGVRLMAWKSAWPDIKANLPLGIGPHKVQDMLSVHYTKAGFELGVDKKLNMHNEYLQQLAGTGIAGLLIWILIILQPLIQSQKLYRSIGVLFALVVGGSALTESILERQAGTIFVCLIGIALVLAYGKEKPDRVHSPHI